MMPFRTRDVGYTAADLQEQWLRCGQDANSIAWQAVHARVVARWRTAGEAGSAPPRRLWRAWRA